ncbi:MAG: hypothetical protein M3361_21735 [Candidatus Tectomicrobia bacterium]|nr:hypothetical protein [Candidatus Tectomicrobia bacterium]
MASFGRYGHSTGLSVRFFPFRETTPICSHLANGGKHFHLRNTNLTSVAGTRQQGGWMEPGWMEPGWIELSALLVDLSPKEQQALQSPSTSIDALSLAVNVLAFWRERLGRHPRPSGASSS